LVKKNSEIAPGVLTEHGKVCFLSNSHCLVSNLYLDQKPSSQC
jgi:hypothetical protein